MSYFGSLKMRLLNQHSTTTDITNSTTRRTIVKTENYYLTTVD